MTASMWLYLIIILYIGIALGLIIRVVQEKSPAILLIAPIIPVFVILLNILISFYMFLKSKKRFSRRIKNFFLSLVYGFQFLPVLLGFSVKILAKSAVNKNLEAFLLKLFSYNTLRTHVESFYKEYIRFFISGMKKNRVRMVRD